METRRPSPLRPDWPFDVRRLPFYYGWVIWVASTLGFLFSIPGQTMGMAVFTEHLIEALGLSRTQLSLAYLIGTVSSALFLTRAGRVYDRLGGRVMVAAASACLALMLAFISITDGLASALGGGVVASFAVITLGYFGVRFFGQGVLTNASKNVLLVWFERRRGLVSSARGVFVTFGFSLAPLLLAWMIAQSDWRMALWQLAAACTLFAALALLALRDNPESCGVPLDGGSSESQQAIHGVARSANLEEARGTGVFWIITLSLSIHSLLITAVTFHIVSIFQEAGRSQTEAFAYFLPQAVASTITSLGCGWLADRYPLKPFLVAMLSAFLVGALGLLTLDIPLGYGLMVAGFGIGGGLWGVISSLAFIRNFGPLSLGEISGFCAAVMVFASAIGPAMFSLGVDWFGSYAAAEIAAAVMILVLLVAACLVPHRETLQAPTLQ